VCAGSVAADSTNLAPTPYKPKKPSPAKKFLGSLVSFPSTGAKAGMPSTPGAYGGTNTVFTPSARKPKLRIRLISSSAAAARASPPARQCVVRNLVVSVPRPEEVTTAAAACVESPVPGAHPHAFYISPSQGAPSPFGDPPALESVLPYSGRVPASAFAFVPETPVLRPSIRQHPSPDTTTIRKKFEFSFVKRMPIGELQHLDGINDQNLAAFCEQMKDLKLLPLLSFPSPPTVSGVKRPRPSTDERSSEE
jgi:hypothetical protein